MDDFTNHTASKRAVISAASSGANQLVAAVAGKCLRVVDFCFVCDDAVTVKFTDGSGGTGLTGVMSFAANTGMAPPFSPWGKFQTTAGNGLFVTLGGAVGIRGWLVYQEVG